jgi:ribose transport system permease protein
MERRMKFRFDPQLIGPLVALMVVVAAVSISSNRFLDPGNLANISLQAAIIALIAIGSTIVIFTGGIDLSSGSMIALLTMILAVAIRDGGLLLEIALVVVLVIGVLIGAFNGMVSAYLRIPSFITTLAGLISFRGMALLFNNGSPIFSLDPRLEPIFYGTVVGIPLPFLYIIVFYALAAVFMSRTRTGREIYAVGGNAPAARLSGIKVERIQTIAFVIAGFMTAVGSILMAARLNSGSPNYGQTMELQAIAAAVVGGASLSGGRGNVLSTLIGSFLIVIVQNGLNLNAVPASIQNIILGAIILLAVGVDMWRPELYRRFAELFGRGDAGR